MYVHPSHFPPLAVCSYATSGWIMFGCNVFVCMFLLIEVLLRILILSESEVGCWWSMQQDVIMLKVNEIWWQVCFLKKAKKSINLMSRNFSGQAEMFLVHEPAWEMCLHDQFHLFNHINYIMLHFSSIQFNLIYINHPLFCINLQITAHTFNLSTFDFPVVATCRQY